MPTAADPIHADTPTTGAQSNTDHIAGHPRPACDTCFFDGACGLCQRSRAILSALDWLGRLRFVDFTACDQYDLPVDPAVAMSGMPMLTRQGEVLVGFPAIRRALRQTPVGLLPALVMHLPGVSHLGQRVYSHIAANRRRSLACRPIASEPICRDTSSMARPADQSGSTPTILFVCTGNTCRSAMAEALTRDLLARAGRSEPQIISAGIATAPGLPAADQAIAVLAERGIDASTHRTRQLTADLITRADHIYAMSPAHRDAVLALDPSAPVELLDPAGEPIPDPVGLSNAIYRQTANRLAELIAARLALPTEEPTP